MSKINKPFSQYFQKTRIFMYPLLGIKQGSSITPIQTYVSWKDTVRPEDGILVCLYHVRADQDYKTFHKNIMKDNPYFKDFIEVEDNKGVYMFDMNKLRSDWDMFLTGKYSKFSSESKRRMIAFFHSNKDDYAYIHSWLYPEKYFMLYSDLLDVKVRILREVGELCSPPDLSRETLEIQVKSLDVPSIIS